MDADDWQAAGLYHPEAPGADDRLALLRYLAGRGATLAQMVDADRTGTLSGLAGNLVLITGGESPTVSVEDMAARCGVPVERLRRVLLAAGLPVAADSQLPEDLSGLIAAFEEGSALMGEDATLAFTRVLGASATNIAEAAVALFYAEFGPGTGRAGSDELARAHLSEAATRAFAHVPSVTSALVLAQFDRATRRAALARSPSAPTGTSGDDIAGEPSEIAALGFVDLVGSTRWAGELSLRDLSLALSRFESAAWSSAVLAGGRVVKMIGDEVFFSAPSADAACQIGTEVCQAAEADSVLPAARGAVGYGTATPREGDYFGPLVNLVARLVKVAAPGQLVVTEAAAAALRSDRWVRLPLGPQPVRGLPAPVTVFSVKPVSLSFDGPGR